MCRTNNPLRCSRYKSKVENIRIKSRVVTSQTGKRKKDFQLKNGGPFFDSLCSLVDYYKTNPYEAPVSECLYYLFAPLILTVKFNRSIRISKFISTNPFLISVLTWGKTGSTQILDRRKLSSYFARFQYPVHFSLDPAITIRTCLLSHSG
jgi:hypothetical protein